jgi:hypothetical protein
VARESEHVVTLMPRRCPPFVELWRDRHGKVRCYFRKDRGPRLPLPNAIGSDEFNAAYQAALGGQLAPLRERHARAAATVEAGVMPAEGRNLSSGVLSKMAR